MLIDNQRLFLRENVQVEPLLNRWYAVPLMIPPATFAMYLVNLHLKILNSYILSPELHAAAAQDPAMTGGPFINYQNSRVPEVKALLDETIRENAGRIEFAEAVKSLDQMLRKEAKGYSLEPLYERVPDILKGYVELTYDFNNTPSFRFIEKLLYLSPLYNPTSQSVGLSFITQDVRPFVLSTPRLDGEGYLNLKIPFANDGLDELFRMKERARPFGEIKEILGAGAEDDELLYSFMTPEAPAIPDENKLSGDGVRVRYFGHACLLIETKDVNILTDPLISYRYDDGGLPRYTFADLPAFIDYVIITHGHLDHLVIETLLHLRHKVGKLIVPRNGGLSPADPSLKLLLNSLGFKDVVEVAEFDVSDIIGGSIISLPFLGEHHDLNILGKTTYLVSVCGKSILLVADYCNLEPKLCAKVNEIFGDIDVVYLGMECDGAPLSWYYGPLLTKKLDREMDYSRRGSSSDHKRGIDMVTRLKCRRAYIYAMGLEPWLSYILAIRNDEGSMRMNEVKNFIADCRERGIPSQMLYGRQSILL